MNWARLNSYPDYWQLLHLTALELELEALDSAELLVWARFDSWAELWERSEAEASSAMLPYCGIPRVLRRFLSLRLRRNLSRAREGCARFDH